MQGFIAWMWKCVKEPAIGYVDLGSAAPPTGDATLALQRAQQREPGHA